VTAGELLRQGWTWRPGVVLVLSAVIAVHVTRLRFTRPWRTLALLGAAAATVLALASPIELLARGTLFSAHMAQHMLLTLVLPPLAILSLPTTSSDTGGARGANVLAPWAAGVGAMWIWHASPLCNAAATSDAVRALQSVSLPLLGAAFWWPIVGPQVGRRLTEPVAVVYLLSACLACTLLGVSIAFSPVAVCSAYGHPADPLGLLPLVRGWGLTPEVDQQLGGLLMWIPGCTAYAGAVLAIVARFYAAPHAKVQEAS
jgi:putative membrane protein